jgi:basic membrane protein A
MERFKEKMLMVLLVCLALIFLSGSAETNIALVLEVGEEIGNPQNFSFSDMVFKGLEDASRDFDLEIIVSIPESEEEYGLILSALAESNEYDLILCAATCYHDAMGRALSLVAEGFPNQKFGIIDSAIDGSNIMSIIFAEREIAYMIGSLSKALALHYNAPCAALILGERGPVSYHYEAGYIIGFWQEPNAVYGRYGWPEVKLAGFYMGAKNTLEYRKIAAERVLAKGAVCVYSVTGPLGIGTIQAVVEKHQELGTTSGPPFYIGVDINQDWLQSGGYTIASGVKHFDLASYKIVEAVVQGTFLAGIIELGLAEGGVSISDKDDLLELMELEIDGQRLVDPSEAGRILANWEANRNSIPEWVWKHAKSVEKLIRTCEGFYISNPDTKKEIEKVRWYFGATYMD